jgi:hypothetical protein
MTRFYVTTTIPYVNARPRLDSRANRRTMRRAGGKAPARSLFPRQGAATK